MGPAESKQQRGRSNRRSRHNDAPPPPITISQATFAGSPSTQQQQPQPQASAGADANETDTIKTTTEILIDGQPLEDERDGSDSAQDEVQLSDFIGEHGAYQLSITTILFVRYIFLGLMANAGPLMTPDVTFYCHLPMQEVLSIMPNISTMSPREQELEIKEEFKQVCQIDLHLYHQPNQTAGNASSAGANSTTPTRPHKGLGGMSPSGSPLPLAGSSPSTASVSNLKFPYGAPHHHHNKNNSSAQHNSGLTSATASKAHHLINPQPPPPQPKPPAPNPPPPNRIRECTDFTYQLAPDQGRTMTSEFDLVCDRDWLRSLFQSLLSAAIVVAHVFWGTFSDKHGRFNASRLCLVVSLIAGTSSIFAWDFWSFTLMRALCSFGDLGLVVSMTTTMVELVGSKYRGLSVALVNFGYALGVSLLPYVVAYCEDFRLVVGLTVLCHMITMPFVLATNESIRWLLTNRKFKLARRELKRIMRWNRSVGEFWPFNSTGERGQVKKHLELANGNLHLANGKQTENQEVEVSLLDQRREFQHKFEQFIRQLESQNLCDPIAASQRAQRADLSACPTPRVSIVRHQPEANVILATRRASADQEALSSQSPTTQAEVHRNQLNLPVKPRVLEMVDIEQLQLIKEMDTVAQQQETQMRSLGLIRPRTMSCSLLDGASMRSVDPDQHQQGHQQQQSLNENTRRILDAKLKTLTLPRPSASGSSGNSSLQGDGLPSELAPGYRLSRRYNHHQQQQQQHQCSPDCINLVAHQLSFVGRVSRLFKDKKLMIAVFTIVWTTFNSELLYTSFIIINLEVGEDVYLNYLLGGCMEALAAIVASLLLSYSPRRLSLIAFWLLISFSCFGLSLAHIDSTWAVWMLALAKFSQSCLSSIASVAAYESFPTFLRQSGSGLVFTLGMLGSVFAPLIFAEFDDHAGMDRVLMTFSVSSLTAAILIYLFLNETRDCELM